MIVSDPIPLMVLATVVGFLIGATGIGGVLLPPGLMQLQGLAVHDAMALAMFAFAGPGLFAWLRHGSRVVTDRWLLFAAVPGALVGALALAFVAETLAIALLASVLVLSAIRLLHPSIHRPRAGRSAVSRSSTHAATGMLTGFCSALTATSGPLVLLPLLLWQGAALPSAILLGQLIQLPISLAVTSVHTLNGEAPLGAGLVMGLLLISGTMAGQYFAQRLPSRLLSGTVCLLLLGTAGAMLWRLSSS
ncbi:MAG: sulfite exporter TauE/SafE family protein [Pigmentiphaga sp.]|nr:sulfite exporter TauE/SafE family protein [Pigmentiphaga sp.]